jgi:hypothetical protein
MRLSYLRYMLKTATDPRKLFEQESEELDLSPSSDRCSWHLKQQAAFRLSRSRRKITVDQ